jgi:hypothetical protein
MKRISGLPALLAVFAAAPTAVAAIYKYDAFLDGLSASPPNASPGTGLSQLYYDDVAHSLTVDVRFSGLLGYPSGAHIHAATPTPYTGLSIVATTVPTFAGFPTDVRTGTHHTVLDLTQESSFNPAFDGGSPATQEVALMTSIAQGKAYFNIHTSEVASGETIGFYISLPGDYNNDGFVDAADYTVWRDTLGQMAASLAADGDNSNLIDEADYVAWRQNFGHSRFDFVPGHGNGAAVPEPTSLTLFGIAWLVLSLSRRRC